MRVAKHLAYNYYSLKKKSFAKNPEYSHFVNIFKFHKFIMEFFFALISSALSVLLLRLSRTSFN